MRLILLIICSTLGTSHSWLLPERCQQNPRPKRSDGNHQVAPTSDDIHKIAADQLKRQQDNYKDYQFIGMLVDKETCEYTSSNIIRTKYTAYNCSFHTYAPSPLSSVLCNSGSCKLLHAVATQDSYTASEGYNWGVKVSAKAEFKVFEVGGEASTGGSYTCTYTKGRTTTDTVECSAPAKGILQLYSVRTDMICDFGTVTSELDMRNGEVLVSSMEFNDDEKQEIKDNASASNICHADYIVDLNGISDRLLDKLVSEFPDYHPYTDLVLIDSFPPLFISYFKQTGTKQRRRKVIPFTNENGDSVFEYACMFTPS